jgi:3-hydroxyisobutyrate dehydrogenase
VRVGFVGLGVMGFPMAAHLVRAGHSVTAHNRTQAKVERWAAEAGGEVAASPADAVRDADVAVTIVGNDDDVRAIVLGNEGVLAGLAPGALLIDHTTTSAVLARELAAAAAELDIAFVDAPVSGGQAGAESGQLTIMCGGEVGAVERARPVFDAYAKAVTHIGPTGHGQLAKMANQICIAGILQGLAEAIDFARRTGTDATRVIEAISQGAAGSWQMTNRAATMLKGEYDFGFAVDWMVKDLGYVLDEAQRAGATVELTELVAAFYREVQASGGNRWDTSSLLTRLES